MFNFFRSCPPNDTWIRASASQEPSNQFKQPTVSDSCYQSRTSDVCQEPEEEIIEEEIRGRRYRGKYGHASVSLRGPSARQRGLAAPEIRTSVSPDRILRRRRRIHRLGPRSDPPDIIDLRSDSEEPQSAGESMDAQSSHTPILISSTQSSSATLVTQPVMFIDLTRIPSASPRRRVPASASSQEPVPRSQSLETSSSSRSTVRPGWLEDAIAEVEKEFPRARFVVNAQGMILNDRPENWETQCNDCEEYVAIPAGPGRTLKMLADHLNDMHPHFRRNPVATEAGYGTFVDPPTTVHLELHRSPLKHHEPTPAASISGTSQRTPEILLAPRTESSVVQAFLAEHGLGPDVLPILQDVGITDHARMRALGRLPEQYLDRLEGGLSDRGLDLAACLLVREGLRRLAEAG